jgi:type IV pilus assembly protein PilC
MTTFRWEGLSSQGKRVGGRIRAINPKAAVTALRRHGIVPLQNRIEEITDPVPILGVLTRRRGLRPRNIALLCRQLAAMMQAGLPIIEALAILGARSQHAALRTLLTQTRTALETGASLSEALRRHPDAVGPVFLAMIHVGESAGALDRVLLQIADQIDKSVQLRDKVARALVYPIAVILVAGVVTIALLLFVIPVFAELFAGFGQALPLPTRLVIATSEAVVIYGPSMGVLIVLLAALVTRALKTASGRIIIDELLLRTPLLGRLIARASVARVTAALASLLSAGVTILDALSIAATTAGNVAVERAVTTARTAVQGGRSLAEPLIASGVFDPMVCQMIAVGERTGSLDSMLERAAALCESEVDRSVAMSLALLEPAIMVGLGLIMGGLVISMYLPIFRLGNVL